MMVKEKFYVDVINLLHEAERDAGVDEGSCGTKNAPGSQRGHVPEADGTQGVAAAVRVGDPRPPDDAHARRRRGPRVASNGRHQDSHSGRRSITRPSASITAPLDELQPAPAALGELAVAQRDHRDRDHQRVVGDVAGDVEREVAVVRRRRELVLREHGRVDRGQAGGAQQLDEVHQRPPAPPPPSSDGRQRLGAAAPRACARRCPVSPPPGSTSDGPWPQREEVLHVERADRQRHAAPAPSARASTWPTARNTLSQAAMNAK